MIRNKNIKTPIDIKCAGVILLGNKCHQNQMNHEVRLVETTITPKVITAVENYVATTSRPSKARIRKCQ